MCFRRITKQQQAQTLHTHTHNTQNAIIINIEVCCVWIYDMMFFSRRSIFFLFSFSVIKKTTATKEGKAQAWATQIGYMHCGTTRGMVS